jgi:hypothetical protein
MTRARGRRSGYFLKLKTGEEVPVTALGKKFPGKYSSAGLRWTWYQQVVRQDTGETVIAQAKNLELHT